MFNPIKSVISFVSKKISEIRGAFSTTSTHYSVTKRHWDLPTKEEIAALQEECSRMESLSENENHCATQNETHREGHFVKIDSKDLTLDEIENVPIEQILENGPFYREGGAIVR